MANDKCVAIKCEVKDIFDKGLSKAVLKQMGETVQKLVNKKKGKGLYFDNKCKDGWLITGKIISLTADDPKQPKKLEVKISIDGVPLDGSSNGFKSSAGGNVTGVSAKNVEDKAKLVVGDVIEALMNDKAIPHMLK